MENSEIEGLIIDRTSIYKNILDPKFGQYHALDPSDIPVLALMKEAVAGFKDNTGQPVNEARLLYDQFIEQIIPAPEISYLEEQVGGVNGWWCLPDNVILGSAILYFYGGAYNLGSAFSYRNFVSHIARISKIPVFIPQYRLAPENPFPAAVEDGQFCYNGLLEKGYDKISIVGDSAGGGLALVTLAWATRNAVLGICLKPISAVAISPWTDLGFESPSLKSNGEVDILLSEKSLRGNAERYVNNEDSKNPRISPVYGNLDGLPPIQIHVGEAEILLDDSLRYANQASKCGVETAIHVWEGMPHVFPANVNQLVAAKEALALMGDFLIKMNT
ncbi:alpha/beta hydrolase [Dyadobacter chenwenxiniae]|uniref:Alpha/beta hydrolase n=1 Tax=Dyadobacter chenwenxiniae TaxID=2906456 RepID=A0A9X1PT31_9BACT|nr:alpha/beta hydrolase [Dyadobacter chenwenxiniae]MCF0065579.1 alpha/beta hydrolase [Dyadobacter chenwenxiniae]UON85490.1 alpha/beta hydrolase [Dyadobacter chenwenxiniae]